MRIDLLPASGSCDTLVHIGFFPCRGRYSGVAPGDVQQDGGDVCRWRMSDKRVYIYIYMSVIILQIWMQLKDTNQNIKHIIIIRAIDTYVYYMYYLLYLQVACICFVASRHFQLMFQENSKRPAMITSALDKKPANIFYLSRYLRQPKVRLCQER